MKHTSLILLGIATGTIITEVLRDYHLRRQSDLTSLCMRDLQRLRWAAQSGRPGHQDLARIDAEITARYARQSSASMTSTRTD